MKIYTKTGDKGETGIIGKRISKNSHIIDTVGTLDELNAAIGVVCATITEHRAVVNELQKIQSSIFAVGGLAAGGKFSLDLKKETKDLEKNIDKMEKELEPLQNFILPGGTQAASHIHLSRAICRRAERKLIEFLNNYENEVEREEHKKNLEIYDSELRSYINRLSDYLFVLARYLNKKEGVGDVKWSGV